MGRKFQNLLPIPLQESHRRHMRSEKAPEPPFAFVGPVPVPAPTVAMSENTDEFWKHIKTQL